MSRRSASHSPTSRVQGRKEEGGGEGTDIIGCQQY